MWFVVLTAFITVIVVISAWEVITERVAEYMAAFLILSGLMVGVFAALDGLLFYVFFEATLIPMYIIIGVWGGPNRVYAAFKFFLYTLLGSLLTLVALIYLYNKTGTFEILQWHDAKLSMNEQIALFVAFFMAFAVKVPMWPVHTAARRPRGSADRRFGGAGCHHAEAGCLRLPAVLAADRAGRQPYAGPVHHHHLADRGDLHRPGGAGAGRHEKLVAYSSIAHMGFVTLGFFIFSEIGVEGGIVQMISHGFISGAMFLCIGVLYDRVHCARSPTTAAWSTPCRSTPRSPCSSPWPTAACPRLPASSASSW